MSVIITVSSTVYNLAGDEVDRIHYLRSLVTRNILSGTKESLGDSLRRGYLEGPGIKMRSFYRWADNPDNFGSIGMPSGKMEIQGSVNADTVAAHISVPPGDSVWVQQAQVGNADLKYWAQRWIFENRPEDANGPWVADFDRETMVMTITFDPDDPLNPENEAWVPTDIQQLVLTDFDANARYIVAYYVIVEANKFGPYEEGTPVILAAGESFPSTAGWNTDSLWSGPGPVLERHTRELEEIVVSYSDGRPTETYNTTGAWSTTTSPGVTETNNWYSRKTNTSSGNTISFLNEYMNTKETSVITSEFSSSSTTTTDTQSWEDPPGSGTMVTMTTTTTTTTEVWQDVAELERSYQIDSQTEIAKRYSDTKVMIYQIGSGNAALDASIAEGADYKEFFPVIPVRIENKFLSPSQWPTQYAQAKKAYKKAVDGSYDELIENLSENKNLKEMDYVFVTFGVALNVLDNKCRRYIYTFFEKLMETQSFDFTDYQSWKTYTEEQQAIADVWNAWKASQQDDGTDGGGGGSTNEPEPPRPVFIPLKTNQLNVRGQGGLGQHYDMRIAYTYVLYGSGTGLGKAGARRGDCWIVNAGSESFAGGNFFGGVGGSYGSGSTTNEKIRIYWQTHDNAYSFLEVLGLIHRNYVYQGHVVTTRAHEALADSEESGFIIPLHYDTWRSVSLVDASQMATASAFLVVNAYQVQVLPKKKRRWWQVFLIIIIAIVSVVLTGGAGFGLLGSHLALGTSLGLSGMSAAIVGSIINAMAALVVATVLEKVTEGMGGIGRILGAILMIVVGAISSAMASGGLASLNWGQLVNVENLIKLTDAVLGGIMGDRIDKLNKDTMNIHQQMLDYGEYVKRESAKIQQAFLEKFGYGSAGMDPMMFVDSTNHMINESRDTFLTRTLLTGSDIADMSHELLNGFAELTLQLPDAFT